MAGLFGKAVDFYKSGVKATVSAGLDIARDHILPKQEINEENLMSKEEATDFSGHTAVINSLAVSKDGETLFSAGKDQKIRMWHTRTGKSAGIVGDQESEVLLRCESSGLCSDTQLQVNQIVVDDDSDLLYSCDVAGSIKKWNWRTAKDSFAQDADASQLAPLAVRPKAHSSDVNGIALSPADPSKLFSCGADDKIRVSGCARRMAAATLFRNLLACLRVP
jgi:WD40 repeat protein